MSYEIDPAIGDFVSQTLVTDSVAYQVVAKTAHTLTIATAGHGAVVDRESNGSPYPIVFTEVLPAGNDAHRTVVRRNKLGHFAPHRGKPLYMTPVRNGKPVTRCDYSY